MILVGVLAVAAVPTVLYLQNRGGSGGTSSDERVFARPGAPFTFHYPVGWKEISVKPGAALNKPTYSMELGLDQQDLIGAQTYAVRFDVKPDGSAVDRASGRAIPRVELQRDIDVRLEQIGKAAGMTRIDAPATGKLGELPARIYRYRGQGATSTFYVAFQNATEYFVNCHAGSQPDRDEGGLRPRDVDLRPAPVGARATSRSSASRSRRCARSSAPAGPGSRP